MKNKKNTILPLRIAGLGIDFCVPRNAGIDLAEFQSFERRGYQVADLHIKFQAVDSMAESGKILMEEENMCWRNSNGHTELVLWEDDGVTPHAILSANKGWNMLEIYARTSASAAGLLKTLGEISFRTALLFHEGLVVHASAIAWEGRGIIFSAPTETGKTTQANMWKQYLGATILNGDRPALRIQGTMPVVYGTPWSGSAPEFQNAWAPLSAVVLLEQGAQNQVRDLLPHEAASRLATRCFLPYWDRDLMEMALSNLERIVQEVPVSLLQCRPDREAVEMVRQWVK